MVSSPSSRQTSHVARPSFHASRVSASPIHEISHIFSRDFASHEISALADFPSPDSKSLNFHRLVRFYRAGIDVAVGTRHRVIHSQLRGGGCRDELGIFLPECRPAIVSATSQLPTHSTRRSHHVAGNHHRSHQRRQCGSNGWNDPSRSAKLEPGDLPISCEESMDNGRAQLLDDPEFLRPWPGRYDPQETFRA